MPNPYQLVLDYLGQIKNLTQDKNNFEKVMNKQKEFHEIETQNQISSYINDNKKLYNGYQTLLEDNQKFSLGHKFFNELILRLIKYHIPNLNSKNLILEMMNLNEKNVEIVVEIQKMEKKLEKIIGKNNVAFEEKTKIESNIIDLKNQLNNIKIKYSLLEQKLKEYEI